MNAIVAWILSILGIVVVGTVIDLVMPNGRMHKYIRSIFATVTILIIILPLPNLIKNGFQLDGDFIIDNNFQLDQNFVDFANRQKIRSLELGVEKALEQEGIKGADVSIQAEVNGNEINITGVTINLSNVVIDEKLQHINKYELTQGFVTKFLNVEKGIIVMHG